MEVENGLESGIKKQGAGKTPLRMRYEAEVAVIKKKWGDLEAIRGHLGLSRRKMAQLLMVDPSAWTRWVNEGSAPPHVYRALQWYLLLIEKEPSWNPRQSFQASRDFEAERRIDELKKALKRQNLVFLGALVLLGGIQIIEFLL